jgi:hypothetical protein
VQAQVLPETGIMLLVLLLVVLLLLVLPVLCCSWHSCWSPQAAAAAAAAAHLCFTQGACIVILQASNAKAGVLKGSRGAPGQ